MLTRLVATNLLLLLLVPPVSAQRFRSDPAEHAAYLTYPVNDLVRWALTESAQETSTSLYLEISFFLEELTDRLNAAEPVGISNELHLEFGSFRRHMVTALAAYEAVRIPGGNPENETASDDPAIVAARQALMLSIQQGIAAVGSASAKFATANSAAMQGHACRRMKALWPVMVGGGLMNRDETFMGAKVTAGWGDRPEMNALVGDVFGPESANRARVAARGLAQQLAACSGEGVPAWTLSQEREIAPAHQVSFLTTDSIPWTAEGLPASAHARVDALGSSIYVRFVAAAKE